MFHNVIYVNLSHTNVNRGHSMLIHSSAAGKVLRLWRNTSATFNDVTAVPGGGSFRLRDADLVLRAGPGYLPESVRSNLCSPGNREESIDMTRATGSLGSGDGSRPTTDAASRTRPQRQPKAWRASARTRRPRAATIPQPSGCGKTSVPRPTTSRPSPECLDGLRSPR